MRIVLQKVSSATVRVKPDYGRSIGVGFVALVGVSDSDGEEEVAWTAHKIAHLRVFSDSADKMNLDIAAVGGAILSISQFTLFADVHKGNRPSFVRAGEPTHANAVWEKLNSELHTEYGLDVEPGVFGTHMEVSLVNDGPVTIILDTDSDMKH